MKFYNEKLTAGQIYYVSLIRYYLNVQQTEIFKPSELVKWAYERGLIKKSIMTNPVWYGLVFYRPLHEHHFINHIEASRCYALTFRARLLLNTYEKYLRAYIQSSQRNYLRPEDTETETTA
jgi:hypothetical protein